MLGPLGLDDTRMPQPSVTEHAGVLGAYSAGIAPNGAADCAVLVDDSDQSSSMGGAAAGAVVEPRGHAAAQRGVRHGALLSEATERKQWTTMPARRLRAGMADGRHRRRCSTDRCAARPARPPGALTAAFTDPESGLTVVVALNNSTPGADFVRETAFALASLASKANAADGRERPLVELPWSARPGHGEDAGARHLPEGVADALGELRVETLDAVYLRARSGCRADAASARLFPWRTIGGNISLEAVV